jgi:Protein of unknown function (DUF3180)
VSGPALKPVRRTDLAVVAVGLGVATWVLVRSFYGELPPLHWWLSLPLGVLAVAEALGARTLRVRLQAERDARSGRSPQEQGNPAALVRPVEPLLVARVAVLAQASAYIGAAFVGVWAGVLAHVAPAIGRLEAAGGDAVSSVIGVVLSAGLVVAALRLEAVCRVPPRDDDGRSGPRVRA